MIGTNRPAFVRLCVLLGAAVGVGGCMVERNCACPDLTRMLGTYRSATFEARTGDPTPVEEMRFELGGRVALLVPGPDGKPEIHRGRYRLCGRELTMWFADGYRNWTAYIEGPTLMLHDELTGRTAYYVPEGRGDTPVFSVPSPPQPEGPLAAGAVAP